MRVPCYNVALSVVMISFIRAALASELEKVPPAEGAAIDFIRDKALQELERRYPVTDQTVVRRDAHAKAHGCVKAIFQVDEQLPEKLRVGTFAQPGKRFKAWIRFSNGAFEPGTDAGPDGRGMALKIIDADPDHPLVQPQDPIPVHDILMINYPVFFSPNVADYKDFADAGALTGNVDALKRYFASGFNPFAWRVRQGYVAYRIASGPLSSPLGAEYFSMTAFAYGSGRAVKYSAKACSSAPTPPPRTKTYDFLGDALYSTLLEGEACLELLVQERVGDMSVEDALTEWPQSQSIYRRIGTIRISAQDTRAAGRIDFCENLTFNPWHAPEDQRPLGGINRVRRAVYDAISSYRLLRNKASESDPNEGWNRY